ncbi:hypothetical protein COZ14_03160 [Candidatus Dojkabacteria bacterium CG_4_10_14_3_um_filter_Dojkabacteria_WS6_41_9]|nr:MAG: hypothetical protein COZ14_03160 [Candidatus Dojkabacteria bacterium CG_4_10_14_3_um_filter_Dojkabacteria_WS6_41_9]
MPIAKCKALSEILPFGKKVSARTFLVWNTINDNIPYSINTASNKTVLIRSLVVLILSNTNWTNVNRQKQTNYLPRAGPNGAQIFEPVKPNSGIVDILWKNGGAVKHVDYE